MLSFLLAPLAAAGTVVVDARIPVEGWRSDRLVGEVAMPAELHIPADVGPVEVTLMIGGKPVKETVEVPATGAALVIVGRTGVTTGVREMPVPTAASTSSQVEF